MSVGYIILIGLLLFNSLLASARAALVGASRARLRQLAEGVAGVSQSRDSQPIQL